MLVKWQIYIIMLFLLLIPFGSTVDFEVGEGELTEDDIEQAQAQVRALSEINQSIVDAQAANHEDAQSLAAFYMLTMQEFQSNFLIMLIIIVLATVGLNWAVFLFLKSRGLL